MSNLVKRILIGIAGIPLILSACYFGGIYYFIFSLVVSTIALNEFYELFENVNYSPVKSTGIFFSVLILSLNYFLNYDFLPIAFTAFLFFILAEFFGKENKNPLNILIAISGIFYVTMPFVLFSELSKFSGINLMILIFILIWTCDTFAYFGGRILGKHKLSPISPGKTTEGALAGMVFTVAVSLSFHFLKPENLSLKEALIIGFITGTVSQAGDLFESLIKRYCNKKNSSELIPGHGGMLDRFDSFLLVSPSVYIYMKYFG